MIPEARTRTEQKNKNRIATALRVVLTTPTYHHLLGNLMVSVEDSEVMRRAVTVGASTNTSSPDYTTTGVDGRQRRTHYYLDLHKQHPGYCSIRKNTFPYYTSQGPIPNSTLYRYI